MKSKNSLFENRSLKWCFGLSVAVCFPLFGAAADIASSQDSVMQALSEVDQAEVRFEETRESGFLSSLLLVKGVLSYDSPDKLRRVVEEPYDEIVEVEGDSVTITRNDDGRISKQRVDLESYPVVRSVVESMRSTLSGNIEQLEALFSIKWDGPEDDWTMSLEPINPKLKEKIDRIVVTGSLAQVKTIITEEADGDESTMTLTYVDHQ